MSAFGGKADMTSCGNPLSRSLFGVKRTCPFALHMSAFDPKRTSQVLHVYSQLAQEVSGASPVGVSPNRFLDKDRRIVDRGNLAEVGGPSQRESQAAGTAVDIENLFAIFDSCELDKWTLKSFAPMSCS